MRRLPLSTENVPARDAAAVQAARVPCAVRVALTDALVACDSNTFETKEPDILDVSARLVLTRNESRSK